MKALDNGKCRWMFGRPETGHNRAIFANSLLRSIAILLLLKTLVPTLHAQFDYGIQDTNYGKLVIQGYTGAAGSVVVPRETNGLPVWSIGPGAFANCGTVTNIVLPDSIVWIQSSAFFGCTNLTSVTLGNGVVELASWVFGNCTNLTSLTFPPSLRYLDSYDFANCPNLVRILFQGNAPNGLGPILGDGPSSATVYYLPGTRNWTPVVFAHIVSPGAPTVLWNPAIQTHDGQFGVRGKQFGFNITGSSNAVFVVEATATLGQTAWTPLATNTLAGSPLYFADATWASSPSRLYRLRFP